VPAACAAWLGGAGPQASRAWLEATCEAALPAGASPRLVLLEDAAGSPAVLLPLLAPARGAWQSLTTPYTCLYGPTGDPALGDAGWRAAGRAVAPLARRHGPVRLEAMDPDAAGLAAFLAGLRVGGVLALRYAHFGNWHEPVAGLGWAGYLAARPGALRETIRRRLRAAERDGAVRLTIARDPAEVPDALAAYETVYARSWKVPEPFPRFNATLLPRLAAHGWLRLAVLWRGQEPVAAQYWTVCGGVATVLKLAHDDAHKALSPGTVLTAQVIRRLLDEENVTELDFGRGDDPYKPGWAARRRPRVGVVLASPLRPAGLVAALRHGAGRVRRRREASAAQP
jgi:CelD/BcsL family acetyltransferase involved in cellulose biosynthesis